MFLQGLNTLMQNKIFLKKISWSKLWFGNQNLGRNFREFYIRQNKGDMFP